MNQKHITNITLYGPYIIYNVIYKYNEFRSPSHNATTTQQSIGVHRCNVVLDTLRVSCVAMQQFLAARVCVPFRESRGLKTVAPVLSHLMQLMQIRCKGIS
jgi:hypothetical protein